MKYIFSLFYFMCMGVLLACVSAQTWFGWEKKYWDRDSSVLLNSTLSLSLPSGLHFPMVPAGAEPSPLCVLREPRQQRSFFPAPSYPEARVSNLRAAGVAAGVEEIPEPSGKKRDLPAVPSASRGVGRVVRPSGRPWE